MPLHASIDPTVIFQHLGERVAELAVENATQAGTIHTLKQVVAQLQNQNDALASDLAAANDRAEKAEAALWEQPDPTAASTEPPAPELLE